ncbi:hypothetical protein PCH_Pc13g01140 [Penicillium rubens Wisconsin 54-1255]|uniref:Uncharacterized protein n=1 Tax=Penicillium rubens (strain ATCC 28089 / DSM 1075 / NRRL 1951 / Wisconsin 54-1255) TaxID=500485 RepID=B6H1M2_PENRW|nr:hypothetical protein PCH_Pc13g01140 [Penicillium rubens Wisconsin 54-1255]
MTSVGKTIANVSHERNRVREQEAKPSGSFIPTPKRAIQEQGPDHDYDFGTAHKAKTVLPVFVLRQHGKRPDWVLIRWPQGDEPLGAQLADLHNALPRPNAPIRKEI